MEQSFLAGWCWPAPARHWWGRPHRKLSGQRARTEDLSGIVPGVFRDSPEPIVAGTDRGRRTGRVVREVARGR